MTIWVNQRYQVLVPACLACLIAIVAALGLLFLITQTNSEPNSDVKLDVREVRIVSLIDVCPNHATVSVVGNGPLSEEDRAVIQQSQCVVRMNDCRNRRPGERTDVVALRDTGPGPPLLQADSCSYPVWPVCAKERLQVGSAIDTLVTPIVRVEEKGYAHSLAEDSVLFPACAGSKPHSEAWAGPSTGAAVIDALQQMPIVREIQVFGMNWSMGEVTHHVDFKHPGLVRECCNECTVHPTPRDSYDGSV
jgi:hypothetical protein